MKKLDPSRPLETLRAVVRGRVQGVGFRVATVRQAHALAVCGWVRNVPDGTVEVLMQGEPDAIDRLLSWLHSGPPAARVADVTHGTETTSTRFDRFEVI